jgi:hypothetical protein
VNSFTQLQIHLQFLNSSEPLGSQGHREDVALQSALRYPSAGHIVAGPDQAPSDEAAGGGSTKQNRCNASHASWVSAGQRQAAKRSISKPWRSPRSLTERLSLPSLSITVLTMHAPDRITSARFGCSPTIVRRSSSLCEE